MSLLSAYYSFHVLAFAPIMIIHLVNVVLSASDHNLHERAVDASPSSFQDSTWYFVFKTLESYAWDNKGQFVYCLQKQACMTAYNARLDLNNTAPSMLSYFLTYFIQSPFVEYADYGGMKDAFQNGQNMTDCSVTYANCPFFVSTSLQYLLSYFSL